MKKLPKGAVDTHDEAHGVSAERRQGATVTTRKAYVSPKLVDLGDMRGLTLGGSPGPGESGNAMVFRP